MFAKTKCTRHIAKQQRDGAGGVRGHARQAGEHQRRQFQTSNRVESRRYREMMRNGSDKLRLEFNGAYKAIRLDCKNRTAHLTQHRLSRIANKEPWYSSATHGSHDQQVRLH